MVPEDPQRIAMDTSTTNGISADSKLSEKVLDVTASDTQANGGDTEATLQVCHDTLPLYFKV